MPIRELAVVGGAASASALLTWLVRKHAVSQGVFDVPGTRSSHSIPTPRGGGLAAVGTILFGSWLLFSHMAPCCWGLLLAAAAVAVVGYIDDRHSLPARHRFIVHVAAALLFIATVHLYGAPTPLLNPIPDELGIPLLVVAVVWSVNLYNFMDGIDGIAASQVVFVSIATMLLLGEQTDVSLWRILMALTAGATSGFLVWNWPPAKIFMGDVGSGFFGFWIATTAVLLHVSDVLSIWSSVVLSSLFLADASTTLITRVVTGHRWYDAHRSHAYQILARKWNSHLKVTLLAWLINIGVVLPAAYASKIWKNAAVWIACALVAVLCVACFFVGAGRDEEQRGGSG